MPEIRLVSAADFTAIAALTNHWIRTTAIHFGYDEVTADELRQAWLDHRDLYPWLLAEVAGRFAGYAKAGVWRGRTAYSWTPESTVYVAPDQHRHGIGRRLYGRLLLVLKEQGFRSAIGGIALPNDASVALHEALGFTHVGTVHDAGYKFGRWHAVGFWQARLGDGGGPLRTPASAFAATSP